MSLSEIFASCGGGLLVLLTLVQIAPIKLNPWSAIARAIGNAMNKDMIKKVDSIEKKVDDLKNRHVSYELKKDEESIDECRSRILKFGDECRRGVEHSEEFFNQILEDITRYENYCREHPEYENSKAVNTIEKINKIYQHCVDEDSFL